MRRLLLPLIAFAAVLPSSATAATRSLGIADAVPRVCQDRLLQGAAGTDSVTYRAARTGLVTVTLDGGSGDWDLALFHRDGRLDTASATMGAKEKALAYLKEGQSMVAQACRRSGSAKQASLSFDLYPYTPPARREEASLVRVPLAGPGAFEALEATGVDVTHAHDADHAEVVLYGKRDERTLRDAGFTFTVLQQDLGALDAAEFRRNRAFAAQFGRSLLPSGRTTYRQYADFGTDLKALVTQNPGLVQPITIGRSIEDRPIEGVEIADGVARKDDGRPTFVTMGAHHAREWPSAEMPMEFAMDLVKRHKAGEARVVDLLKRVRVIAIPIINPDGFVVSRGANGGQTTPADETPATLPLALSDSGSYKRKNCRNTIGTSSTQPPVVGTVPSPPCAVRQGSGVDINRNYGAYWGGVGSSDDGSTQGYRGQAPYSEPETEAVHRLSQNRNIVTLITHHTYTEAGTWLRQPGFCPFGPPGCQPNADIVPDEAGMKALGDAMGQATGWESQLGWAIGEITGATEDWNYFAANAFGFTPEQRGPNFHPNYATAVVAEYDGTGKNAKGGVREALLRATEQAGDARFHSVLTGTALPGTVLKLVKVFDTPTSQPSRFVRDQIEVSTTVPATGQIEWHVNPSSRPLALNKEQYLLRCETPTGTLLQARPVQVDRGQRLDLGQPCSGPLAPGADKPTVFGANNLQPVTLTRAAAPGTSTTTTRTAERDLLVISRLSFRAKTVNRRKRVAALLRVDGALQNVRIRLTARGGRTVAQGRLAKINSDRPITLRFSRRVKPGVHRIVATAVARDGVAVKATRKVLVRR